LPTYEYACTACGHRLDAVQKFSDDPLTECPECGGALRKVYGAVGIVLKGSGFYKTDSRAAAGTNGKNGKGSRTGEGSSSSDSSGSDSSGTSEKKDAAGTSEKKDAAGSDGGTKSDSSRKDSKPATAAAT
jgi:putative FmdB family regulatory protein